MILVQQKHEILNPDDFVKMGKLIESAGRTCYKSEDRITDESYKQFTKHIAGLGHGSVLEHSLLTVKFTTDRGVTHELVRHRLASYSQESTRYCNYSKDKFDNQVTFIEPSDYDKWTEDQKNNFSNFLSNCEKEYHNMISSNMKPQQARAVLPNCLKTEIVVSANYREWAHIMKVRCISKAAHPDIRALMAPLYEKLRQELPEIFELGDME